MEPQSSTSGRPVVECVVVVGYGSGWMSTAAMAGVDGLDIGEVAISGS